MVKMNYPGEIEPRKFNHRSIDHALDTCRVKFGKKDYCWFEISEKKSTTWQRTSNNFVKRCVRFGGSRSQSEEYKRYLLSKRGRLHHASHRGSLSLLYGRIVLRRLSLEPYHLTLLRGNNVSPSSFIRSLSLCRSLSLFARDKTIESPWLMVPGPHQTATMSACCYLTRGISRLTFHVLYTPGVNCQRL